MGPLPNGRTLWLTNGDYQLLDLTGMILQVGNISCFFYNHPTNQSKHVPPHEYDNRCSGYQDNKMISDDDTANNTNSDNNKGNNNDNFNKDIEKDKDDYDDDDDDDDHYHDDDHDDNDDLSSTKNDHLPFNKNTPPFFNGKPRPSCLAGLILCQAYTRLGFDPREAPEEALTCQVILFKDEAFRGRGFSASEDGPKFRSLTFGT